MGRVQDTAGDGYAAYFKNNLHQFNFDAAVRAQAALLKTTHDQEDVWSCFAAYTMAVHCLDGDGRNISADPVQAAIDTHACKTYQEDARAFARDAVAAVNGQIDAYPDATVRIAFYTPINGLLLNILDDRDGENVITLDKAMPVDDRKAVIESRAETFAAFYETGRDFCASWVDAVQRHQSREVERKSASALWTIFHNVQAERDWPYFARNSILKSFGFYTAA